MGDEAKKITVHDVAEDVLTQAGLYFRRLPYTLHRGAEVISRKDVLGGLEKMRENIRRQRAEQNGDQG